MTLSRDGDYINSVNLYAGSPFPYLVLDVVNGQSFPHNPGFRVMHWHEDLQFIYVESGEIEIRTLEQSAPLSAGDGVFINKNVVHQVIQRSVCHYHSFVFPDYFLSFYPGGPAEKLVRLVTQNQNLPLFLMQTSQEQYCPCLRILAQLLALEKEKTQSYPYQVLVLLTQLWLEMQKHIFSPFQPEESSVERRMRTFLRYIHQHYAEELALADLAGSANVSKSECLRCFKSSLQTTPYHYLMEYRLSKAAALLESTDIPVGEISVSVGFHQMSYFGKRFREKTGYSPTNYRHLYQKSSFIT